MDVLSRILPAFIAGCLAGVLAAVALIASNVGDLRVLLDQPDGWLGAGLLTFGLTSTFGSAAFGAAVWFDRSEDD